MRKKRLSTEQTSTILNEMLLARTDIYLKCAAIRCFNHEKCIKRNMVCLTGQQNEKCVRAGANFKRYITLRNMIVENNIGFVVQKARTIGGHDTDLNDLIQEGILGVIRATEMFNPEIGKNFVTYAFHHIRKRMIKHIVENRVVRKKKYISDILVMIRDAFDQIVQEKNGSSVEPHEIIAKIKEIRAKRPNRIGLRITKEMVQDELNILNTELKYSFDKKTWSYETDVHIQQEHGHGLYELMNSTLDDELTVENINVSEIIHMRFGLGNYSRPMNSIEIGSIMGITRQRVESIIKKIFSKMNRT